MNSLFAASSADIINVAMRAARERVPVGQRRRYLPLDCHFRQVPA